MSRLKLVRGALTLLASMLVLLLAAACNDDDGGGDDGDGASATASAEEIAAVEEIMRTLLGTDPTDTAQVDFFLGHMTDEVMEAFFGSTKEDCAQNAEDCIGEPTEVDRFEGTAVTGSAARTTVYDDESGTAFTVNLVLVNDVWQVDEIRFGPAAVPAGVTAVDLQLNEYAFGFNASQIEDGNIAFPYENVGEEPHEVAVLKTNEEFDLDAAVEALTSGEENPPGVDEIFYAGFAPPGGGGIAVFADPLDTGTYVFVCTVPDAEGTPHVSLGMTAEFEVQE